MARRRSKISQKIAEAKAKAAYGDLSEDPSAEEATPEADVGTSGFSGAGGSIPQSVEAEDLKTKKEKDQEKAAKTERRNRLMSVFEDHKVLCADIQKVMQQFDIMIARMSSLQKRMLEPEFSPLRLDRRLSLDQLMNDAKIASQRVSRARNKSLFMNSARRGAALEDADDDKVYFE
jgi:hypothetical protein